MDEPELLTFPIWSTTAVLGVMDDEALPYAKAMLDSVLADIEQAASRFRPETEIESINAAAGKGPARISPVLADLVGHALLAAQLTEGSCDPTVADSLLQLGYDRDFDDITDTVTTEEVHPSPGVSDIEFDPDNCTLTLPAGVHLDLGATAKARAADIAAERISTALHTGVLVDIGGDLRVLGTPPPGGWRIGVTASARDAESVVDEVISIKEGGIASSSSVVRAWGDGKRRYHHIIDPKTGRPAETPWSLVTVAAPTCVEANAFSTAAMVWGEDALFELPQRSLVARLVRHDGTVERIGGWPEAEAGA